MGVLEFTNVLKQGCYRDVLVHTIRATLTKAFTRHTRRRILCKVEGRKKEAACANGGKEVVFFSVHAIHPQGSLDLHLVTDHDRLIRADAVLGLPHLLVPVDAGEDDEDNHSNDCQGNGHAEPHAENHPLELEAL